MNKLKILAVTCNGISSAAAYGTDEDVKNFLLNAGFSEPGSISTYESGLCSTPVEGKKFIIYHKAPDGIDKGTFKLVRLDGDMETVIDRGYVATELANKGDSLMFEGCGQYLPRWGFICDPKTTEENIHALSPFQRVAAHPKGALAILRFLRGALANNEKEMERAMYEVTDIYDEIFDEPAMMPRFMAEMLHGT